ncbi:MAG: 50S ribosomal protein L32 [Bacteroidales bacterium]|jgi:large subunit ribosomal protein L32|nr:50S ribosomal protein L32 [Bacteroidales bacterium]
MAHPKSRVSGSRAGKRRSHDKLTAPQLSVCSGCGAAIEYHHVCGTCGMYRGKQAIATAAS